MTSLCKIILYLSCLLNSTEEKRKELVKEDAEDEVVEVNYYPSLSSSLYCTSLTQNIFFKRKIRFVTARLNRDMNCSVRIVEMNWTLKVFVLSMWRCGEGSIESVRATRFIWAIYILKLAYLIEPNNENYKRWLLYFYFWGSERTREEMRGLGFTRRSKQRIQRSWWTDKSPFRISELISSSAALFTKFQTTFHLNGDLKWCTHVLYIWSSLFACFSLFSVSRPNKRSLSNFSASGGELWSFTKFLKKRTNHRTLGRRIVSSFFTIRSRGQLR